MASATTTPELSKDFSFAGGIEDTFIPQSKPGFRPLEEYELTQHYEQWREDLDRAASLGITKLRWGVPWYRVEKKTGQYDWEWVDEVLDYMVNKLHIHPVVDLVHYGTPLWMEQSFADPEYPQRVGAYAGAFAQRYKKLVRFYTPLNEPTVNADWAGRKGEWPPYLTGDRGFVKVLLAITKGIQQEAKAIRQADPDAVLVAVEAMGNCVAGDEKAQAKATLAFQKDVLPWDLVSGKVDEKHPLRQYLLDNGATIAELDQLGRNGVTQDIFGVNFYPWSASVLKTKGNETVSEPGRKDGLQLADVLRRTYEHVRRPLFVTETSAKGEEREAWMRDTLEAVRQVRREGIPVQGYTWFPLITMIEWEYRTSDKPVKDHLIDLGLWDAEFDASGKLVRKHTRLVDQYKEWVRSGLVRSP